MAMNISRAALAEIRQKAERAVASAKGRENKANEVFHHISRSMVTGGTSFLAGMRLGYYGEYDVASVPLEGAAATAFAGAGFIGLGGKMSRHLHSVGNGFLASYLTSVGLGVGAEWALADAAGGAMKTIQDIASKWGQE